MREQAPPGTEWVAGAGAPMAMAVGAMSPKEFPSATWSNIRRGVKTLLNESIYDSVVNKRETNQEKIRKDALEYLLKVGGRGLFGAGRAVIEAKKNPELLDAMMGFLPHLENPTVGYRVSLRKNPKFQGLSITTETGSRIPLSAATKLELRPYFPTKDLETPNILMFPSSRSGLMPWLATLFHEGGHVRLRQDPKFMNRVFNAVVERLPKEYDFYKDAFSKGKLLYGGPEDPEKRGSRFEEAFVNRLAMNTLSELYNKRGLRERVLPQYEQQIKNYRQEEALMPYNTDYYDVLNLFMNR